MTMLPEITKEHVADAMAAWGDREGMEDAMKGRPANPDRHCPDPLFQWCYLLAHAESVRARDEVARMEFPHAGVGDEAGGAQGTRSTGNTLRWRDRILWASVGLAIGSWCTGIAVYVSTVLT